MNKKEIGLLSQGFQSQQEATVLSNEERGTCPPSEQIWDAANGKLTARQRRKIVNHTANCPACAQSWRLARHLNGEAGTETKQGTPNGPIKPVIPFNRILRKPYLAAAALVITVLGLGLFINNPLEPKPDVFRGGEQYQLKSLLNEQSLDPKACLLSWQLEPASEQMVYQVKVTTENVFTIVFQAQNLSDKQVLIPEENLAKLPAGTHLIWQVTALFPDGHTVSTSFVNPLK